MAYVPPQGDNVILDLTGEAYSPPDGDSLKLDLQSNPYIADSLEIEYDTDLWDPAPINVSLEKPRFRARFTDTTGASGVAVTGVKITVIDVSDLTTVWASGVMDFAAMDAAGHPILPPGVHFLYPGETCTVKYNVNETAEYPGFLLKDAERYSISLIFYLDTLYTSEAFSYFTMVSEVVEATDPEATITYTDISVLPIVATWATDPTAVRPIKPWFRATYHTSFSDLSEEYVATDVYVEVIDITNPLVPVLVWQSGRLNFAVYDNPPYDTPILPNHAHVLRDGEICEIPYNFNSTASRLRLPRDGSTYRFRMMFYCEREDVYSTWAEGTIGMFQETWEATSLLCEGLTNPTNVIDITPEFDATFHSTHTEFNTPKVKSYQLQVSDVPGFGSIRWDTGTIEDELIPDLSDLVYLPTTSYAGTAFRRDGTMKYWRVKLTVIPEWAPGGEELDWFTVQNWTFFNEVWSTSDVKTDGSVTPSALKDYYPEYTAQFNDNYSEARAILARVQVCPYKDIAITGNLRCYRFDSTDEISIGDVAVLNIVSDLTLEFWIRPTATSLRTNIVDKCYGGEYAITYETDGRISYYHGSAGSMTTPYIGRSWAMGMTLNNWYHVAITRNNTAHEIRCYIAPYGVGHTHTDLGTGGASTWETPVASADPVRIGRGYCANTYQGDICQVRFWNTVRTTNQLDEYAYKELPSGTANLVGQYKLNETSGNALDTSGQGNTGTVIGTIERRSDGPEYYASYDVGPDWDNIKWDSDWVDIGSVLPGETIPAVPYPSPYEVADDGFYWDGSKFGVRVKLTVDSDGEYETDWSESYFTMGVAIIDAMDPRVDGVHGSLRVRNFLPGFTAQYVTDAFDPVSYGTDKAREYATNVRIQISTSNTVWTTPSLVWESSWDPVSYQTEVLIPPIVDYILTPDTGPVSDIKRVPDVNESQVPYNYLTYDTVYYWRIRFTNERGLVGNWSEVMQFTCVGCVYSEVSNTDIINAFYLGEEYEIYAESKADYIYYSIVRISTGVVLVSNYLLNKGFQPRLIFDGDETSASYGQITLLFLSNGKIYERHWQIDNYDPGTAPTTSPQLIDGSVDITRTPFNPIDIEDVAQRPYVPGGSPVNIYIGTICDETGNLYPGKTYLVEFSIPANHSYFYDLSTTPAYPKTYRVYVQNGTFDGSYSDLIDGALRDVAVGALGYVPASDLGCDITNTQKSKLTPWLPDMEEDDVETIPKRAVFVSSSKMMIGLDTFGFFHTPSIHYPYPSPGGYQSFMGCVPTDAAYFYSISQTMLYKKSVYPPEDLFGFTESLMGNITTDATFLYSISQTMLYKKSVYPPEDNFGDDESLMGATYEVKFPYEWASGDYYYGQYWSIHNYYDARIR